MDILDILLDILLKPPQPFIGLFLLNADLSKFDSQYYNIRYIHSLLLNSGPWTEKINTQL